MAFIVPGVVRFSVNQSIGSRNVANVLDYSIDESVGSLTREEACAQHADTIADKWANTLGLLQSNDLTLQNVSWVDLSTETGSTGVAGGGASPPWPTSAEGTGAVMPSNVAVLMHKNLAGGARGSRRGRSYISGVQEGATDANEPRALAASDAAAFSTQGELFRLATTAAVVGYGATFRVVHIISRDDDGTPLVGSSQEVISFLADPILATQRRRLR